MSLVSVSVGKLPFWAYQVAVVLSLLIMAAAWRHMTANGPSFTVQGLNAPATVTDHKNDAEYAMAVARRFVRAYTNWSYSGHLPAKRRAAYLCNEPMAAFLWTAARSKDSDYRLLRNVQNGQILSSKVTWKDPETERYVVEVEIDMREWQAHLGTRYPMVAQVQLAPAAERVDRPILVEIVAYDFKVTGDVVTLPPAPQEPLDILLGRIEAAQAAGTDTEAIGLDVPSSGDGAVPPPAKPAASEPIKSEGGKPEPAKPSHPVKSKPAESTK